VRGEPQAPEHLNTDHVDVYFCHIWWDKHEETEAFIEAFDRLKKDGKVRAVSVSTNDLDHIKHFDRDGGLDVVQLDYSILNREPEREILPYLEERGIGVVVRGPLRMGILTGSSRRRRPSPRATSEGTGHRSDGSRRALRRWSACAPSRTGGRSGSSRCATCSAIRRSPWRSPAPRRPPR
jgi:aryl-alcohol dehydrogenase-like predicted oxidoreductase